MTDGPVTPSAVRSGRVEARRARARQLVRDGVAVRSPELARALGVSVATARRDAAVLSAEPGVLRVHGGLLRCDDRPDDAGAAPDVLETLRSCATAVLGWGPQTERTAARLPPGRPLLVVTASLVVAGLLAGRGWPFDRLLLLPGSVDEAGVLTGPLALRALAGLRVDLAVHDDATTPGQHALVEALATSSRRTVALGPCG